MEYVRVQHDQWLELKISGRLDAQWSDTLEHELSDLTRGGVRQIRLAMADVVFLSSAGIRVLLKCRKELVAAQGRMLIVSPSETVRTVLQLTGLQMLLEESAAPDGPQPVSPADSSASLLDGGSVTLYHPESGAALSLWTVGDAAPDEAAGYACSHRIELPDDTMAVGWGGFGSSFDECRPQFGEFMALGGSAITLPTDGGSPPDFLAGVDRFVPSVQALNAVVCQGRFAHFFQFSADSDAAAIPLSRLVSAAFAVCGANCMALAMIAETDGLVGASLLRSPALPASASLLSFPAVRDRLALTSEPEWPRSLAMVCGIALLHEQPELSHFVRPMGAGATVGHFHATALSYRALPGGQLELAPTVASLMETQNLLGLMHLVNDTRPITGIGESSFLRGAVWCGPATLREATP